MKKLEKTYTNFLVVTKDKELEPGVVAIAFKNEGNTSVTINNALTINAGDPLFSVSQNEGDIDFTKYKISFGPGSTPKLVVITVNKEVNC